MPLTETINGLHWTKIHWPATGITNLSQDMKLAAIQFWFEAHEATPGVDAAAQRITAIESHDASKFREFQYCKIPTIVSRWLTVYAIGATEKGKGGWIMADVFKTKIPTNQLCLIYVNYKKYYRRNKQSTRKSVMRYYATVKNADQLIIFAPSRGEVKIQASLLEMYFDDIFLDEQKAIEKFSLTTFVRRASRTPKPMGSVASTSQTSATGATPLPAIAPGAVASAQFSELDGIDLTGADLSDWGIDDLV